MRLRLALLVIIIVLLLPGGAARSAVVLTPPFPNIGLGFDPSSIQPVTDAVPVYTQGDSVWVQSYYNSSAAVYLTSPAGTNVSNLESLPAGGLALLHTFAPGDHSGSWLVSVVVSAPFGPFVGSVKAEVMFDLQDSNSSLVPALVGQNLTSGKLNQEFSLPSTAAYNVQACSIGTNSTSAVSLRLPVGVDAVMGVSLEGEGAVVSVPATQDPFATWFELYSPHAYQRGQALVSEELLTGKTAPLVFNGSAGISLAQFSEQMHMRPGRYDLRSYVRSGAGLSANENEFLLTGKNTWISLGACTYLADVHAQKFSMTTNLGSSNGTWPRQLFTMYAVNGVESYSELPVPGSAAAIDLRSQIQLQPLTGVGMSVGGPGVGAWEAYNSGVYLIMNQFPSTVSVELSFGGVTTRTVNMSIPAPNWSTVKFVQVGTLAAYTTLDGKSLGNSTVTISAVDSQPAVQASDGQGMVSLLLPPGSYVVSAAYSGRTASQAVSVRNAEQSKVTLELSVQAFPVLEYVLAALGVALIVANVFAWRRYVERRRLYG